MFFFLQIICIKNLQSAMQIQPPLPRFYGNCGTIASFPRGVIDVEYNEYVFIYISYTIHTLQFTYKHVNYISSHTFHMQKYEKNRLFWIVVSLDTRFLCSIRYIHLSLKFGVLEIYMIFLKYIAMNNMYVENF